MRSKLVIIKFGGSLITVKDAPRPTPRTAVVRSLAKQIRTLHKSGQYKIVVVHGGGSYGHPIASRYQTHKGMRTADQKLGFCKVSQMMLELNKIIVDNLIDEAVPAISLPPRAFVLQSAGRIKKFDCQILERILEVGHHVPVLFGDAVLDLRQGSSILSGDVIVTYLARKLQTNKVLFLSDVDGIYDQDPKLSPGARRIEKVDDHNLKEILGGIALKNKSDVTGEMRGKILSIKKNLRQIEVIIASGLLDGNLTRAVSSKVAVGTRLRFQ